MANPPPKIQKSEDEWRAVLNKEQFRILREKGTEPAGTGEYEHLKDDGLCVPLPLDRRTSDAPLHIGIYTCAGELHPE